MSARGPTMRQHVEGMAVGFDPAAAGALRAVVELSFIGDDPGTYQLAIEDGACRFDRAPASAPDLRIETDAETWRAIAEQRLPAMTAVLDGRLSVQGDLGLFQRFSTLFRRIGREDLRAPPGQHAPGPVRLPAMAWLFVGLVPWKTFWVLLAASGATRAVYGAGVVSAGILLLRAIAGGATFLEWTTAVVFAGGSLALALGASPPPGILGESFLALAAIWAASVVYARFPLTGEYARWNYVPRLWPTGLFRHPNAWLTLLWAVVFFAFAMVGAGGARGWIPARISTVISILVCVVAGAYTRRREALARDRRVERLDASLARMRVLARGLLLATGAAVFVMGDPRVQPGWILVPAAVFVSAALWPTARGVRTPAAPRSGSGEREIAVG